MALTKAQQKKIVQAKISLLEAAYQEFHLRLEELKKEQDNIINKAIENIDRKKIEDTLQKIKKV